MVRYKDAGVDIDKAEIFKNKAKILIRKTFTKSVVSDIGLFSGLYSLSGCTYSDPVMVSSIDGVGTKTVVARVMNRHEVIGYDVVSHGVNDILAQGAKPLFFLDYIGTGRLDSKISIQLIKGMTKACIQTGCSLIGGETAQMPDVYSQGEYDLAGCIIGIVNKNKIINGSEITPGDSVIGLKSIGLHTNGYTLARKVLLSKFSVNSYVKSLKSTVGEALLQPHKNYYKSIALLLDKIRIRGIAHITGGGLVNNIPRILPKNTGVVLYQNRWSVLPIFKLIRAEGNVPVNEMYRAFNMGIGMVLIVRKKDERTVLKIINGSRLIGEVVKGKGVKIND